MASFNKQVAGLSSATNPDLSFLQIFPSGVAGASIPQAVTTPIPPNPLLTSEVLAPYKPQLEEVLTLVNQISTLNNRVRLLQGLFASVPSFNPAGFLDLVSYLDRLEDIYTDDRNTLVASLQRCLGATSANVTSVCQSIIANQATNAFEYYAANGPGNNFFAQQNTLALQYTGVHTLQEASPLLQDVIYIDELPSFAAQGSPVPIAGEAAFVSFVDRPVPGPGGTLPFVDILALEPDAPLSTNNVSTKVRTTAAPSPFTLYEASIGGVNSLPPASFTSVSCTPTFTQPCAINYFFSPGGGLPQPETVENRQIQDLFD